MIPTSLSTRRTVLPDGSSACAYPFKGEDVLVNDSASNALEIYLLYQDESVDEEEKALREIGMIFVNPDDAYLACDYSMATFGDLIHKVLLEVFGIETRETVSNEPELFDVVEDAALIRTSLRMAYNIDWDEVRDFVSWVEFLTLIWSLPYETPLGARMYYRNPKNRPKPDKYNKEQVKEFDKYASLFALNKKQSSHDNAEDANSAMTDVALSLAALV